MNIFAVHIAHEQTVYYITLRYINLLQIATLVASPAALASFVETYPNRKLLIKFATDRNEISGI